MSNSSVLQSQNKASQCLILASGHAFCRFKVQMGVSSLMNGHTFIRTSKSYTTVSNNYQRRGLGAEVCMQWLSNWINDPVLSIERKLNTVRLRLGDLNQWFNCRDTNRLRFMLVPCSWRFAAEIQSGFQMTLCKDQAVNNHTSWSRQK